MPRCGSRGLGVAGCAVLTACLACGQAKAQTSRRPDIGGGVSITASFDPKAAKSSDAAAALRGLEQEETIYNASANVAGSIPLGRFATTIAASGGYVAHEKNSRLNSFNVSLNTGVTAQTGICGEGVSAAYSRGQSRLEDLDLLITDNISETYNVSASVQCAPIAGITGGLSSGYSESYNSSIRSVGHSTSSNVSVSLGYGNRALGAISAFATFAKVDYKGASSPILLPMPAVTSRSVGVSYSRPIGRKLAGSASVAYSTTDSGGTLSTKSNDITANVGLSYRVSDRLNSALSYGRNVSATNVQGAGYVFVENVSGNISYSLNRRISTGLAASYSVQNYRGQTAVVVVGPRLTRNENRSLSGNVGFKLTRNSSLGLSGSYSERRSNINVLTYSSTSASVSFFASF